jgi:hypothetical protein
MVLGNEVKMMIFLVPMKFRRSRWKKKILKNFSSSYNQVIWSLKHSWLKSQHRTTILKCPPPSYCEIWIFGGYLSLVLMYETSKIQKHEKSTKRNKIKINYHSYIYKHHATQFTARDQDPVKKFLWPMCLPWGPFKSEAFLGYGMTWDRS